jgi:heptosyltransferase-2
VAEVIARLTREARVSCVLVGSPADAAAGRQVAGALRDVPVLDAIGRTDLPAVIGVMARCAAFVCNDSGAMHLASAVGVPAVIPFGATDEIATAPLGPHTIVIGHAWCRPCLRRECPLDHRCMWTIDSTRVFEAVARHVETARLDGS